MNKNRFYQWRVPIFLLLLGSLNVLSGAFQLYAIPKGPPIDPDPFASLHYFVTPLPIVLHIIAGILFNLLGPLQFARPILKRWPGWHRWTGRLLIPSGYLIGLTGLWMNHFFPAYGGFLKYSGVALSSLGVIASLTLSLTVILKGDVKSHRAWMMRAIALVLGPATQRLFLMPMFFINGGLSDLTIGLGVWFGFLLNLVVVEWTLFRERDSGMWKFKGNMQEAV